jgi:signal transduction histidine kinase
MAGPARRRVRRRPGRNLLALFGMTILLPGLLLAVFAVRAMIHERRFAEQQHRDRLERAADAALRDLERDVREWHSALDGRVKGRANLDSLPPLLREALVLPGSGAVVTVGAGYADVWPDEQLLYAATAPVSAPPLNSRLTGIIAAGERAELRERDYAGAIALYRRAVALSRGAERAWPVHRLARTLRKAGRTTEALAAYQELSASTERIGALPAALIGTHEICALLAAEGSREPLTQSALDLYRGLVSGRWRVDRERYAYYADAARGWLAGQPSAAAELAQLNADEQQKAALAAAVEEVAATATLHTPANATRFALLGRVGDRSPVILLSMAWLSERAWPETFRSTLADGFDVAIIGPGDEAVFDSGHGAPHPALARVSTRAAADAHVPWRVRVTPRDPAAFTADIARRQEAYLVVLAMVVALLGVGGYITARAVKHELELARLQSEFVSTVSHEFRSPLTGIRQLGELLARGRVPTEERRQEYYERITHESDRLARLVENILDFSQMEHGRKQYRIERLETAAWLQRVVADARGLQARGSAVVVASIPSDLPAIEADPAAMSSAIHNLLDNAIKYSPGRPAVWLDAEARNGRVTIRVRDEGVGIGPGELDRVFERFYRAEAEVTREVKGAGLGLSLVRHVVDAHDGAVACKSQPGQGSTFTIELPAADQQIRG